VQRQLLQRPAEYLPGFQDAIRDFIAGLDATRALVKDTEVFVGISGEFGDQELSPRELSSAQLGRLVKVFGIVTKCSLVRPKLVTSVHYCPESKLTLKREYRDVTALVGLPTGEEFTPGTWGGGRGPAERSARRGGPAAAARWAQAWGVAPAAPAATRAGSRRPLRARRAGPASVRPVSSYPRASLSSPPGQARPTPRAIRTATCW
jgi:hypothetical protein